MKMKTAIDCNTQHSNQLATTKQQVQCAKKLELPLWGHISLKVELITDLLYRRSSIRAKLTSYNSQSLKIKTLYQKLFLRTIKRQLSKLSLQSPICNWLYDFQQQTVLYQAKMKLPQVGTIQVHTQIIQGLLLNDLLKTLPALRTALLRVGVPQILNNEQLSPLQNKRTLTLGVRKTLQQSKFLQNKLKTCQKFEKIYPSLQQVDKIEVIKEQEVTEMSSQQVAIYGGFSMISMVRAKITNNSTNSNIQTRLAKKVLKIQKENNKGQVLLGQDQSSHTFQNRGKRTLSEGRNGRDNQSLNHVNGSNGNGEKNIALKQKQNFLPSKASINDSRRDKSLRNRIGQEKNSNNQRREQQLGFRKKKSKIKVTKLQHQINILSQIRKKDHLLRYYIQKGKEMDHIFMDYYPETLKDEIQGGLLTIELILDLSQQLISSVINIQESGVVHRDIKPSNFLLDRTNPDHLRLVLIDFGQSCSVDDKITDDMPSKGHTLPYSPIETADKNEKGLFKPQIDCWSVGMCLYELMFGKLPVSYSKCFQGDVCLGWGAQCIFSWDMSQKSGARVIEDIFTTMCMKLSVVKQEQRLCLQSAKQIVGHLKKYYRKMVA